ncbi:Transmembrane exosortase [Rubripirellula amarantea]|uniref:Transmembrane exosortase n=1 Tax=Rubripirellula amarantea TaxID=2527999 RepID=A0A5C5WP85_9BACT|nr:exosortase U [Rubripirellula amarantea]TWT52654.1 Transmembrane exosortase [Rubripirellula amarantea]
MTTLEDIMATHGQTNRKPLGYLYWLALLLPFLPMLLPYLASLWSLDYYRFFPIALLTVAFLAWKRVARPLEPPRGYFGWILVGLALALAASSIIVGTFAPAVIGFAIAITGFFWSQSDRSGSSTFALCLPVWVLVRPPFGLDELLIVWLQRASARLMSVILDFVAIPHGIRGNELRLPDKELFVAELCSGILSFYTIAFLAFIIMALMRRKIFLAPVYLAIAVIVSVVAYTAKISLITMADAWLQWDWTSGWASSILGYIILLLCFGLLWSFDNLVASFCHPVEGTHGASEYNPLVKLWNLLFDDGKEASLSQTTETRQSNSRSNMRYVFLSLCLLLTLGTLFASISYVSAGTSSSGDDVSLQLIIDPSPQLIEDATKHLTIEDHQRNRNNENRKLGRNADIWTCTFQDATCQILISQTFSRWQEFSISYQRDWRLLNRGRSSIPEDVTDITDRTPIAMARFRKRVDTANSYGYLLYSALTPDGVAVAPPQDLGRLTAYLDFRRSNQREPLLMMQAWLITEGRLSAAEIDEVRSDFFRIRDSLASEVRSGASSQQPRTPDVPVTGESQGLDQ